LEERPQAREGSEGLVADSPLRLGIGTDAGGIESKCPRLLLKKRYFPSGETL
jgi:hypothetical protein